MKYDELVVGQSGVRMTHSVFKSELKKAMAENDNGVIVSDIKGEVSDNSYMGQAGNGMSSFAKAEIIESMQQGIDIVFYDPEGEFMNRRKGLKNF
jgi:hypothetical protein